MLVPNKILNTPSDERRTLWRDRKRAYLLKKRGKPVMSQKEASALAVAARQRNRRSRAA